MSKLPPDKPPPGGEVNPNLEVQRSSRGRLPGDAYVRIERPAEDEFEHDADRLVATARTLAPSTGWRAGIRRAQNVLVGKPISSEEEESERLTKVKALAVFSSDNISSSAYATEEMMRVLLLAGVAAIVLTLPLTIAIVAVLAVVALSYRQTIRAYPDGASSYLVATDNLGTGAGLLAGAALLIDYTLTVAVSVAAGVAAITSLVPEVHDLRVLLAVLIVALLTLGNLRGIRESGTIFMAPTYLYLLALGGVIIWGLVRQASGDLPTFVPPEGWIPPEGLGLSGLAGLFLILRAFSSGAAALTGVEAISDGVPAFKKPEWRNARVTLTWAALLFGLLFLGISYLAQAMSVIPDPTERQTVLSLVTRQITGGGWYLVLVQVATAMILTLAANTAFADFPRLSSFLARDGFMPRQFSFRGERLAFSTGIVALAGLATILLVGFDASVTALIPLYTLGVFLAFTLSQSGMVTRWWRNRGPGWRFGLAINGLGAATTGVITVIVVSTKFLSGAWVVVLLLPVLIGLMLGIRRHYRRVAVALQVDRLGSAEVPPPPIVVVPIARLDRAARGALRFANAITPHATAVHITNDPESAAELRQRWPEWGGGTELVIVESPYRALIGPLLRYLDALQAQSPNRSVVVVLSEVAPRHWWENFLHNQTTLRLKLRLFGRPGTIVADVPFHLPDE
jgi:amino acid transporter